MGLICIFLTVACTVINLTIVNAILNYKDFVKA